MFVHDAIGQDTIDFQRDIAPIFEKHCLHCHSDNISKGKFSLSTITGLLDEEYLVPGKPDESLLIQAVRRSENLAMPPEKTPTT